MSNPYQEPAETLPIAKKGLTWAEWSIIIALLLILFAFLYAWNAKTSARKAWKEAEVAQTKLESAKEELARLAGTSLQDIEEYLEQIRTMSADMQSLRADLTNLRADLTRWKNYAAELDRFIDAELKTYWMSPSYTRPTRPR